MTYSGTSERILAQAVQALEAIAAQSTGLDDWLDRKAPGELRRALASLLFTFFRRKRAVDAALTPCWSKPPRPEIFFLLELALTLAAFQTALRPESAVNIAVAAAKHRFGAGAGKFVNAVLRRALTLVNPEPPAMELLPEPVARRWVRQCGAAVAARRAELFQRQAPTVARWRRNFAEEIPPDAERLVLPWPSHWQFTRVARPEKATESVLFRKGAFYFQDPAPAAIVMLLENAALPRAVRGADLCAAPGGKLILAEEFLSMKGISAKWVALDRSETRQNLTRENLARCGVAADVTVGDATNWRPEDGGTFDLVLADVPCTNSGVFRRRPDVLWRWRDAALRAMTAIQKEILEHGAELCAPGGYLLYSTCSLEKEENEALTAAFLAGHPEFALTCERSLEPDETHDGTYGALLKRKG